MQGQITGEYRMKTKQWSKTGGNTRHQSPETLRKTGGGRQKETGFYFIFISDIEDGLLLNMLNMQEVSRLTDSSD